MTGPAKPAPSAAPKRRRVERAGELSERSRIFSFLIHTLIQRLDRARREVYGGDLDLASISEAIGLFASAADMRDERWREIYRSFDRKVGLEGQRVTNAMSIAQATGIPRETTRRKIKRLVEMGVLTELKAGQFVTTPGFLQQPEIQARFETAMGDVLRFINDGLELGIFKWSESDEERMPSPPAATAD